MKKIFIIISLILIFSGCTKNLTTIEIKNKEYLSDKCQLNIEIPEIKLNSDFSNKFNSEYITLADNILNSFIAESENSKIPNNSLALKQNITLNKNGIISIVGECKSYTGGPHDTLSRITKNIDIKNSQNISFENLFNDNSYVDRINSYITTLLQTNPEKFKNLWKTPTISENQDFYLTPDGIVIFYPPYELSYYSKGFVEIELPYNEFQSYLNPDYANLIWK